MSTGRLQLISQHLQGTRAMTGLLTTHVLNTASGTPAKSLSLALLELDTSLGKWVQRSRSVTNEDGRCRTLLGDKPLSAATYLLRFDTGDYWKELQTESFFPYVEVVFTITDPTQNHHVPLLLSPFSYTTYRGS
uniref:5-hydroxyisourate hydrolase n=1 Tax=Leptobrachium leishanense TaxID=445787 RepID=A0A8C5LZA5_9ANUR